MSVSTTVQSNNKTYVLTLTETTPVTTSYSYSAPSSSGRLSSGPFACCGLISLVATIASAIYLSVCIADKRRNSQYPYEEVVGIVATVVAVSSCCAICTGIFWCCIVCKRYC